MRMVTQSSAMQVLVRRIQAAASARHQAASGRRHSVGELRRAVRTRLGEIAADVSAARRLWLALPRAPQRPAEDAMPPPQEDSGQAQLARRQRVLGLIRAHPDGIRLVDVGNELGVDWRGLISVVRSLLDERSIGKIGSHYYPMEE